MYSIKKSDCKFYVNTDKKVVTCVCNYNVADRLEIEIERMRRANFSKNSKVNGNVDSFWFDFDTHQQYNKTYTGITKCSDEDQFSIEVGCELAFARMIEKIDNDYFKLMHAVIDEFNRLGNLYSEFVCKQVEKSDSTMSQREQKLRNLLEEKGIEVPYYNDDDIFGGIE